MSLAFTIPGCIILIILIISAICSNLPTRKTLVCTKTSEEEGAKVKTKIVSNFSKEDVHKSSIMTVEVESETNIPDSELQTIEETYKGSYFVDSVETERLADNKASVEFVLSDSTTSSFGTKFQEVRQHLIDNYEMSCNSN